jgi:hypothetical protein
MSDFFRNNLTLLVPRIVRCNLASFMLRSFLSLRLLWLGIFYYCSFPLQIVAGTHALLPDSTRPVNYPPIKLRGYGTLSGTLTKFAGQPASLLKIVCENADKATLVQAKYLSDLQLIPGVHANPPERGTGATIYEVTSQGSVMVARNGSAVSIYAGDIPPADLRKLDPSAFESKPGRSFTAEMAVPMYLDRWDKYGFRFYYGPFTLPKGPDGKEDPGYDPQQDFDFAKKHDTGLILWDTLHPSETAEGETRMGTWSWVVNAAKKDGFALGINDSMGDAESWVFNRYRDQMMMGMPGYVGGWYYVNSYSEGQISWNGNQATDAALGGLQRSMRKVNNVDNVVNWLEPHSEIGHGIPDIMTEYGPVADTAYRKCLQQKYGRDVSAVVKRWYDDAGTLKSWEDVHVPQVASFLGYGPDAIDLTGAWRINYDLPIDESSGLANVDDSKWPTVNAPGDDIEKILNPQPAILRRHFQVDAKWKAAHDHIWLYCFDLNDCRPQPATPDKRAFPGNLVSLNGKKLMEGPTENIQQHLGIYDVSSLIQPGDNLLTLGLSSGTINYKVYLSASPPKMYPALGPKLNAQWVDFIDFVDWERGVQVRRGAQMIRQLDPNRPITFMEPYDYTDTIKSIVDDYGGVFHDTGAMPGIFDCEFLPMLMRSSNMPYDCEPGSGAADLEQFKFFMGNWSTEAIQGIDYFIHIGDIEWKPEIRAYFDEKLPLWRMIGKYHVPKADLAILHSDRSLRLTQFPFDQHRDPNVYIPGGFWEMRLSEPLVEDFPRDTVVEGDFDRGLVDPYKIVIDSNTMIMDPRLVDKIDKWVRKGGIFITYGETGRHTTTDLDAWPIAKLTGYKVTAIEPLDERGKVKEWRHVTLAPNQGVFKPGDWTSPNATGLHLAKTDPACQDLMLWEDGTVAAGLRHVGKGIVIDLGLRYFESSGQGNSQQLLNLIGAIFDWAKIKHVPGKMEPDFDRFHNVLRRYYISNNGLFDVWTLWNTSEKPVTATLNFDKEVTPAYALDIQTGRQIPIQTNAGGSSLPNLAFAERETRIIITPHGKLAEAPAAWFDLQRGWWSGTANPGPIIPQEMPKLALDLSDDWAFQVVADNTPDASALADPKQDDSTWKRIPLGIISLPDYPDLKHGMLRKKFTVPTNWKGGRVTLWVESWQATFFGKGLVYLDGKVVGHASLEGVTNNDFGGALKPGSEHQIAIEFWANGVKPVGVAGGTWLAFRPTPALHQDLKGDWKISADGIAEPSAATLPGPFNGKVATLSVTIDPSQAGRNVVVHAVEKDNNLSGVIINGRYVQRFHHRLGNEFNLNITPWVKFGQANEVRLIAVGPCTVNLIAIDYYDKSAFP